MNEGSERAPDASPIEAAGPFVEDRATRLGRALFGDRTGLLVWLGLLLALATLWRVGIFINDSYAVANTLVNVADGRLAVTNVEYSLTVGTQPGLHQYGGMVYGRNYGQAVAALPLFWLLEALAVVAAPRIVLLGGWALGLLVFARHLAVVVDRRPALPVSGTVVRTTGSVVAVVAVLAGVAIGTPLPEDRLALAALQLCTLLAAATIGLLVYRLLSPFDDAAVAVAAGVAAGLATPVGFWATVPKRHVLVAALLMGGVHLFARARRTGSVRFRAGAYACVGLVAWIHAFEGFFLVIALGGVDLVTARTNGRRELAVVALALLLALAPTFATNAAITGNPLQSPRLLPGAGVGDVELAPGGDLSAGEGNDGISRPGGGDLFDPGPSGADASGSDDGSDAGGTGGENDAGGDRGSGDAGGESGRSTPGDGPIATIVGAFAAFASALIGLLPRPPDTVGLILGFVVGTVVDGLQVLAKPERLWHVFVRSGLIPDVSYATNGFEAIELTVLESMPLLAALAAGPVLFAKRLRRRGRALLEWPRALAPARQTDLLVAVVAAVFVVIYLSRVPIRSSLTVRYLFPLYPLGLYAVVRFAVVSTAISTAPRLLCGAYAATLAGGTLIAVVIFSVIEPALGEAIQFHALSNLAAAVVLGVVVVGRTLRPRRIGERWVVLSLGATAAVTTLYLVLAALAYFPYGAYAFDGARVVAEWLGPLV